MKVETVILLLSKGRFHLEAEMISKTFLLELRYDSYGKTLPDDQYYTKSMNNIRRDPLRQTAVQIQDILNLASETWDNR